jgi:hypothetical protein
MSEFVQQIPLVVGPASIMMGVYYWRRHQRGQRHSVARRRR